MDEYLRDDVEALKAWALWYENGVHSNFSMKTFCVCFSERCEDEMELQKISIK